MLSCFNGSGFLERFFFGDHLHGGEIIAKIRIRFTIGPFGILITLKRFDVGVNQSQLEKVDHLVIDFGFVVLFNTKNVFAEQG